MFGLLICGSAGALTASEEEASKSLLPAPQQLLEDARKGKVAAQLLLGKQYFEGRERPQSYEQAAYWFRQAATANNAEGWFNLAICLEYGLGVEVDLPLAVQAYKASSEAGLPDAMFRLAMLYKTGIPQEYYREASGFPANRKESEKWLLKLLKIQKYPAALRELALLHLEEITPETPSSKREEIIQQLNNAAEAGDGEAGLVLSQLYYKSDLVKANPEKMRYYLELAAKSGLPKAQGSLAFCYEFGIGGAENIPKALELYKSASENGDEAAELRYGEFMLQNKYGLNDPVRGMELIRKAASRRNPKALFRLGVCYAEGVGVEKNDKIAADYFLRSASDGEVQSQFNIAVFYRDGRGIPADQTAAFYWFKQAAQAGNPAALRELGVCYFEGIGTAKSELEGTRYLRMAAEAGDLEAQRIYSGSFQYRSRQF